MSVLRQVSLWLGLAPDEEYEELDARRQGAAAPERHPGAEAAGPATGPTGRPPGSSTSVRTISADDEPAVRRIGAVPATGADAEDAPRPVAGGSSPTVRTMTPERSSEPKVVAPTSFNDAKVVGETFKSGQAVIINLQGLQPDLAHRLVDFASGLCFALDGTMRKVTQSVFLLTPAGTVVDDDRMGL